MASCDSLIESSEQLCDTLTSLSNSETLKVEKSTIIMLYVQYSSVYTYKIYEPNNVYFSGVTKNDKNEILS